MNVSIVRAGHNLHMSRINIVIVGLEEEESGRAQLEASATTAICNFGKIFTGGYYNKNNRTITSRINNDNSKTHLVLPRQMLCHIFLNRFFGLIAQLLYISERVYQFHFYQANKWIGVKVVLKFYKTRKLCCYKTRKLCCYCYFAIMAKGIHDYS
jgi:hypothetical protein